MSMNMQWMAVPSPTNAERSSDKVFEKHSDKLRLNAKLEWPGYLRAIQLFGSEERAIAGTTKWGDRFAQWSAACPQDLDEYRTKATALGYADVRYGSTSRFVYVPRSMLSDTLAGDRISEAYAVELLRSYGQPHWRDDAISRLLVPEPAPSFKPEDRGLVSGRKRVTTIDLTNDTPRDLAQDLDHRPDEPIPSIEDNDFNLRKRRNPPPLDVDHLPPLVKRHHPALPRFINHTQTSGPPGQRIPTLRPRATQPLPRQPTLTSKPPYMAKPPATALSKASPPGNLSSAALPAPAAAKNPSRAHPTPDSLGKKSPSADGSSSGGPPGRVAEGTTVMRSVFQTLSGATPKTVSRETTAARRTQVLEELTKNVANVFPKRSISLTEPTIPHDGKPRQVYIVGWGVESVVLPTRQLAHALIRAIKAVRGELPAAGLEYALRALGLGGLPVAKALDVKIQPAKYDTAVVVANAKASLGFVEDPNGSVPASMDAMQKWWHDGQPEFWDIPSATELQDMVHLGRTFNVGGNEIRETRQE